MKSSHLNYVAWSRNHKDKFVAISSDVKLFEFTNQPQQAQTANGPQVHMPQGRPGANGSLGRSTSGLSQRLPDQLVNSRLIATGPEISSLKAAACYPGTISEDDTLVAISCGGTQNLGKIVLVCLRPAGMHSIDNYVHIDLVAKRAMCNDIGWSYVNNSLLATAWDRHKVDNSLQIFDINRVVDTSKYSFNFSITPNNRPVFDGCQCESISSLEWFRKEQSVVSGVNGKQIRIYDIRDLTKPKPNQTVNTRGVHGLTIDAYSDNRFASYVDNIIYIWDRRNLDKPMVTTIESKPVTQISWCPTRNHSFSALMSGDNFVKIYDIQQACISSEEFEAKIVERLIHPFASSTSSSSSPTNQQGINFEQPLSTIQSLSAPKQVTSFDWHPTNELRLIAISNHRDVIALNICDRITLNWSPICEIVWTKGKRILQCLNPRDEKYKALDDISVNMRHRAITNYGMIVEEGPHHQRGDDSDLIGLLRWVKLAKSLDITSKKRKQSQTQHNQIPSIEQTSNCGNHVTEILGVGSLLRDSAHSTPSRVEVKAINWKGAAATACVMAPIRFHVYHSELRSRALLLCDWIPDIDNISQTIPIIDYLEKEGNYMRAAAIAVFNMRLQRAVESLTMGAKKSDPNLSSVAMALSGYTGERTSMWREMCQSLKGQLTNPYMKAMFAFLTSESDTSFHEIIHDTNLILADRVAFSLLYLPDDKLFAYLDETMTTLVDSGDLNGILLTGITNDGLSLLQRYIEISSDIQSVSLIVLHSLPSAICNDSRAQLWVDCYRGILDCWRLWHQRARFDNLWYSNSLNQLKPANHISISCNYCGSAINKQHNNQNSQQQQHHIHHHIQQQLQSQSVPSGMAQSNDQNREQQLQQQQQQQQQSVGSFTSNSSSLSTMSSHTTTVSVSGLASKSGATISGINQGAHPMGLSSQSNNELALTLSGVTGSPGSRALSGPGARLHGTAGVVSQTPSSGTVRNRSYTNCKKCSFAKCCLCLTQLGSNQVLFDHKNSQHINSKVRQNNISNKSSSINPNISSGTTKQQQLLSSSGWPNSNTIISNTNSSANNKTAGDNSTPSPAAPSNLPKTNPFSNWFSWCQTCRHGAHSAHFLSWFSENNECPVSGCDCKCMNLDSRTKLDDVQML